MSFSILSWALYDLANQFFAINIITLYFSRWLVLEKKVPEIFYSLAFGASVFLVALMAPWLGHLCDQARRPKTFLTFFTMVCIFFTFMLGQTGDVRWALLFFVLANFGCQTAVIFYNALMMTIAPANHMGFVSGFGRTVSYVGAVVALFVVNPRLLPHGYPALFSGTAAAFLFFALPCLLFIKDDPGPLVSPRPPIRTSWPLLVRSLKETCRQPEMSHFLKAALFGLGPINVVILFMAVYAQAVFGLSEPDITRLIGVGTCFAIAGSFLSGFMTDVWGYRRCLVMIFTLWIICFCAGALLQNPKIFFVIGIVAGFALGATFAVSRVAVIRLVRGPKINEAFGLLNLVAYLSSIVGPLCWGIILWILAPWGMVKYRIALFSMNVLMLIGLFYLLRIPREHQGHD